MKIKEVIAQTGLTDRAVRLYIESGLVSPENQKSYTGRNNYHFTQADIERLEQIALLRKAEFSIEQIKILGQGGDTAREMLQAYLTQRREAISTGQKVVEALEKFSEEDPVTLEGVCQKIKVSMEDTPLPESDRKAGRWERIEKWIMRILASALLLFWGLLGFGVLLTYQEDFPFHRYYKSFINYIGTAYVVIPILLSILVIVLYWKELPRPEKRRKRRWIAGIAFAVAIFVCVEPYGLAGLMLFPPVYSETSNPTNYMVLGSYPRMYGEDLQKLFPANIPRCAVAEDSNWYPPDRFLDTTKYYYYYQDEVDPSFQIYAEWVLPEEKFGEEIKRVLTYHEGEETIEVQWGQWTALSFTDSTLDFAEAKDKIDYYYLIFAYNEETHAVRYIASYSMDCGYEEDPYFLALQWE